MNQTSKERIVQWFESYTDSFSNPDISTQKNIALKIHHSREVARIAEQIALSLSLSQEEQELAWTCGLLHDIGRFRQYTEFKTFSDTKSVDHGELGASLPELNKILKTYNQSVAEIIKSTIRLHNKLTIPPDIDNNSLQFLKIVRDADKLDIYRIVTDYYESDEDNKTITLELNHDPRLNHDCLNSLLNKNIISKENLFSVNDFKLLQLSWIFDIHFDYSLSEIKRLNYINRIISTLPHDTTLTEIKKVLYELIHSGNSVVS